ncbi:hypothetical protein VIGAN_10144600 [Vigna angularis var. angularis]|uniref:AMP-dependent synthetase/ligase domain-containing protein n=1 Tax=Vigna angularis var. angularis TaxID=157739 RepID=A0A0S3T4N8_PHAAN|nr:hypothetical protein VIGAN_10144600 [Vigna angularis var. angularis]
MVAALAPNIPALYELHFGVPMAGGVLSALNTQLDVTVLALILEQLEPCKIMFVDYQLIDSALKAFEILSQRKCTLNYNELLATGQNDFEPLKPSNECNPISVNYTSGTTGILPKGVVYSHKVDMFRCNGWCFPWVMPLIGGTNICLRNVSAKGIFDAIHRYKVTHFCGAPTLLDMIANASPTDQRPLPHRVNVTVAGVLPPTHVLNKVSQLGFDVNIGYGMTETYGPFTIRPWNPTSDGEHTKLNYGMSEVMQNVDVKDPKTNESTPPDGKTIGEIVFKGEALMMGYLKNPQATEEAIRGGWYMTGDLGVRQPNGSITMKDRAKDMMYCEGGAVSSLEVEAVLLNHPKVLKAAVVGRCDEYLVESPFAIVELREGCRATVEEIIKFCEDHLASHMVPRSVVFGDLPVNSTGKVQKFRIREKINTESGVTQ